MFALHILASGSKGNACILEDTASHHGILIDCGICKRDFLMRAKEAGFDICNLDAILITHDHSDHTKGLGVVARALSKSGICPTVYALPEVQRVSKEFVAAKELFPCEFLAIGQSLSIGSITVIPFPTSHDAAGSCGFRFESADGDTLGYVTDTGVLGEEAKCLLSQVRLLALEANHDSYMLEHGEYPRQIKIRIASDRGHLSNTQAEEALAGLAHAGLEQVVAMHISDNNNTLPLARQALERALAATGCSAKASAASQHMLVSVR